jgi:hypothetical protein
MSWIEHLRPWRTAVAGLLLALPALPFAASRADEPSVEDMKARVANVSIGDRPSLCLHISERQLDTADKLLIAGDSERAEAALKDVIAFSELARDYAIQSHKHEKQAEIAIRKMANKLTNLKHTIGHEDQEQVQEAIDRLQRIRDDLLEAMFSKGNK